VDSDGIHYAFSAFDNGGNRWCVEIETEDERFGITPMDGDNTLWRKLPKGASITLTQEK